LENRPREEAGWRAGKPVEDPDKTKRWGYVAAKPSEYLVHVRRGKLRKQSSGQGTTCFKWPGDSVAIIPTSLQTLRFTADQVSVEKVGVEVTGLAVFRIANPLLAYRVLNFSYPERAQEKLETTLTEMLVGATRRLVANLSVDDCLRKRKASLADELLSEVAPVVGGSGTPVDQAERGWGVVIDTIEIQEVRVLSEKVFAAMQAPFRTALDQQAREAKAEADKAVAEREASCRKSMEEARIQAEQVIERRRAESERESVMLRAQHGIDEQAAREQQAQAEIRAYEVLATAQSRQQELEHAFLVHSSAKRREEAELAALEGRVAAENALGQAKAQRESAEAQARILMAEKLPALAAAVGQRFGEVKVVQIGGDGNPFATVAQAVGSVLELIKSK